MARIVCMDIIINRLIEESVLIKTDQLYHFFSYTTSPPVPVGLNGLWTKVEHLRNQYNRSDSRKLNKWEIIQIVLVHYTSILTLDVQFQQPWFTGRGGRIGRARVPRGGDRGLEPMVESNQ